MDAIDGEGGLVPPHSWGETIELPLPVGPGESPDVPWLREVARLEPSAIRKLLESRWSAIHRPGTMAIRDRLLELEPTRLAIHGDEGFLKLEGPGGPALYLGRPMSDDEIGATASMPPSDRPTAEEFYRYFPGLRDSPPDCSGEFARPGDWETFGDFGWDLDEEDEPWAEAIVVFIALNGDLLLLGDAGIAWAVLASGSVQPLRGTLDDFLIRCAEFLGRGTPLDSYRGL